MNVISWEVIQRATHGRFGRHYATCPLCSADRRTPLKRHSKVLAIRLEPERALYYCNHCDESGSCYPDSLRRVVDPVELQRRRDAAARHAETEKRERKEQAIRLWDQGQQFRGSPAESYLLQTRGIGDWLDSFASLDEVFRFHPNCWFGGERHPCLIALVRDIKTDEPVAIHRTALTKDDPPLKISRMSLGPVSGGAIKISPDCEVTQGLMIGEGIETVLSASKRFQFRPAWSLIDAGHIEKFPVLSGIECVTIAVDNDGDGKGQKAAAECADRYAKANLEVITTKPTRANDFNELEKRIA